MPRFVMVVTMRPPDWLQRLWYRKLRMPAPQAVASGEPRRTDWVRLLPYRWRNLHRRHADRHGYFWLPCILCGRPYGGHESGDSVPDPTGGPGTGVTICSQCTRAGRGWRVPHPIEAVIDAIHDRYDDDCPHEELTPGCPNCEAINAEILAAFANYQEPDQ